MPRIVMFDVDNTLIVDDDPSLTNRTFADAQTTKEVFKQLHAQGDEIILVSSQSNEQGIKSALEKLNLEKKEISAIKVYGCEKKRTLSGNDIRIETALKNKQPHYDKAIIVDDNCLDVSGKDIIHIQVPYDEQGHPLSDNHLKATLLPNSYLEKISTASEEFKNITGKSNFNEQVKQSRILNNKYAEIIQQQQQQQVIKDCNTTKHSSNLALPIGIGVFSSLAIAGGLAAMTVGALALMGLMTLTAPVAIAAVAIGGIGLIGAACCGFFNSPPAKNKQLNYNDDINIDIKNNEVNFAKG